MEPEPHALGQELPRYSFPAPGWACGAQHVSLWLLPLSHATWCLEVAKEVVELWKQGKPSSTVVAAAAAVGAAQLGSYAHWPRPGLGPRTVLLVGVEWVWGGAWHGLPQAGAGKTWPCAECCRGSHGPDPMT